MSSASTIARLLFAVDEDARLPIGTIVRTPTQARVAACHDRSQWLLAAPGGALLAYMSIRVGLSLHHHSIATALLVMVGWIILGSMVGVALGAFLRRADILDLAPYRLVDAAGDDRVTAPAPIEHDWRTAA